jgi:DNA-binding NarL/FixJ family response regulator
MPIIFLTIDKNQSLAAYEANVVDYLVKPFDQQRFDRAVSKAMEIIAGKTWLKKSIAGENKFKNNEFESILSFYYNLSLTECAICNSIAAGKTISEIIVLHSITHNTLKTHLRRIFSKTIDRDEAPTMEGQRKLQRLTYFLMSLR